MTTPTFGWPFPTLADIPNVPADLQALAEAIDTSNAAIVHLSGGSCALPPSVVTPVAGYSTVRGRASWANPGTGEVTVPETGVYEVTSRTRIQPPAATYTFANTIRNQTEGLAAHWLHDFPQGLGAATIGCTMYQHFAAGTVLFQACYGAGYTGNATVERGEFTVRLVLPG